MVFTDDLILEVLEAEGRFTPSALANRIDKHQKYVNQRCRKLQDFGLVQTVARGLYQITDEGRAYLEGELDASDLEVSDDG